MFQYSTALKVKVAKEYLRGGIGHKALALKHGVSHSKMRFWIDLYKIHGAEGFVRHRGHRTAKFKLSALRHMWAEKLSYTETAAIFKVQNLCWVVEWERLYREGGLEALKPRPGRRREVMSEPKNKPPPVQPDAERSKDELIAELKQLRMENAYLKKLDALVRARQTPKGRK